MKKGFTLIELIVSFTLITVVSISLFKTVLSVQQKQSQNIAINKFKAFQLLLNNEIENDFLKEEIESVNECGINCYDIEFKEIGIKRLSIDKVDNVITYGSFKEKLPDNYKLIDDITITKYESTTSGINSYIFLDIPIKSSLEPSLNSLKYMYTYDSTNKDISGDGTSGSTTACIFNGSLSNGVEYEKDQYTYRYLQEYTPEGWKNIANGWGVKLTNANSTEPISSKICNSINGEPITSTSAMFYNSKATSINISNFDSSEVTNMSEMFSGSAAMVLNINGINTSKVTNMKSMFENTTAAVINVSKFNTSNVLNMGSMFKNSQALVLDLSNFDTSKVTTMQEMFNGANVKTIYASKKFKTDNVSNSNLMFQSNLNLVGINGTIYDDNNSSDKTYARFDEGFSVPGYFVFKDGNYTQTSNVYFSNYQYIDTEINPNETLKYQMKIKMDGVTGSNIIGTYYNYEPEAFRLFNYDNNFYLDYGSGSGYNRINGGTWANNTFYELEIGNRYIKDLSSNSNIINGTEVGSFTMPTSLMIFDQSSGASINGYLSYFRLWRDNILMRDFISVKNNNTNEDGLYDLQNNRFYPKKTQRYQRKEKLYIPASKYIDTGVNPSSNTKFQVGISMENTTGGTVIGLVNAVNGEAQNFRLFNYNNSFYLDYGSGSGYNRINGGTWSNNTKYDLEIGNRYVKSAGSNVISGSAVAAFNYNLPITLLPQNTNSGSIYYLRMWDGNNFVRSYLPATDISTNENGLYDMITQTFYPLKDIN